MAFWKKASLLILVCSTTFVWYLLFTEARGVLTVSVLDVGQGDAVFIETPSGNQVLVDGGPGRAVLSRLGDVMPGYDKSINMLISTHTDADHLGGLVEVLKHYHVDEVIGNDYLAKTDIFQQWEDTIEHDHIAHSSVRAGDRIMLDRDVELDIVSPTPEDFDPAPTVANEIMIVGRLRYGNTSFLLTGDLERGDEIRLAQSNANLSSDVLKVAHHGSKYASTDLFLSRVHPSYAVISVGAHNRYGHPAVETLERVEKTNARIERTDERGTVTFVSDGVHVALQ